MSQLKVTSRHQRILRALSLAQGGLTVRELARALGISRQLALYHVKRLAAHSMLVAQLEPCEANGRVQFRVWDEIQIANHYARKAMVLAGATWPRPTASDYAHTVLRAA